MLNVRRFATVKKVGIYLEVMELVLPKLKKLLMGGDCLQT
jgi:hypothetical protein